MKHLFTYSFLIYLSLQFSFAQEEVATNNTEPKQGIQFFEGSWSELLASAKTKNRAFFVDVYTTWCGPCKMMSKLTFTDKEVGKIANNYFLAFKLDAERGDGVKLAEKYKVKAFPTVLFFNPDGKLVGKEEGYMDQEHFLYVLEKYLKKLHK